MDSRLLNVYHDDPYDANYDHFDSSAADLWSTDNIGLGGMELTDTLDGILPITATETEHDICNLMFDENHIYDDKGFIQIPKQNALVYNDFAQQQIMAGERVGTIDTDLLSNDGDHLRSNNFDNTHVAQDAIGNDDARSQCSEYSFRTRTDSSSIGDYESHSSDYDDDDDEGADNVANGDDDSVFDETEMEKDDILTDLPEMNFLSTDDYMFTANGKKQRTISTNTIGSDVDAANFDLAEFITKDDVPTKVEYIKQPQPIIKPIVQVISSKIDENDSDSDVIVDVETVESEEAKERALLLKNATVQLPEDNLSYVDNVKEDPSWSPKEGRTKPSTNKKQSDTLKSGKLRGKCSAAVKGNNNKVAAKKQILKSTPANVQTSCQSVGMGRGGKNLSLLKRDCESIEKDSCKSRVNEKDIALLNHDSHRIDPRTQSRDKLVQKTETEKRKLNLEEYKRRHGEDFSNISKAKPIENKSVETQPKKAIVTSNPQTPMKAKPHSEAVTSVVKSLKEEQIQNSNQKSDPITQAKNKVLRMQELKKAQQMRIIDSTISAKVPRVTKLLPLQEIIKDTAYAIKNQKTEIKPQLNANPDYIKIVMVSTASNTALSLSPSDVLPNVPLLDNITRVTEHVKISNNSLITSIQDAVVKQSLPKIVCPSIVQLSSNANPKKSEPGFEQHGENKIIMHLRKDRIRAPTRSIAIQTDFQAAFPTLPLPEKFRKSHDSKNSPSRRKYRKRNISTASSASSSSGSSESDDNSDHVRCNNDSYNEYVSTKQNQHRNNGCASSTEYQNSEAAVSVGGYSSRSSRRHRSSVSSSYSESGHQRSSRNRKRQSSYRKSVRKHTRSSSFSSTQSDDSDRSRTRNRTRSRSPYYKDSRRRRDSSSNAGDRNVSKPAVEERRIVYVGRIEEETTKEMLRRKFIVYGSIKQITIHYKENGMKYGFVTFERAQDAFSVIDNSAQDSQISIYDISFGGRRAFCRTSYADLDNAGINNYHSYVFPKAAPPPKPEDSFEALLQKVKAKLDANKSSSSNKT